MLPSAGMVPPGPWRYTRAPLGRASIRSSSGRRYRVRESYQGKPSASSIAGASVSVSERVPNSASAMQSASTTAGTVPAAGPFDGIPRCRRKTSTEAAAGAVPWPLMTRTSRRSATYTMTGTSPPRPKWEISLTAAANVAATPASIAFPPRVSIRMPASAAKCRPAATTPTRPTTSGRYVEEPAMPSIADVWLATSVKTRRPRATAGAKLRARDGTLMWRSRRYHSRGVPIRCRAPTRRTASGCRLLRCGRRRRRPEADVDLQDQEPREPLLRRIGYPWNRAVGIGGRKWLDVLVVDQLVEHQEVEGLVGLGKRYALRRGDPGDRRDHENRDGGWIDQGDLKLAEQLRGDISGEPVRERPRTAER